MQTRRSRMHRTRSGKRLALTPRDIAIFRALVRYRYLRSTYLHAFAGGASVTRFRERLGDLFHEGFLDRPPQQWQFADARYSPVVYEIGAPARRVLEEHGGCEAVTFLADKAHRQFAHALMICECVASIELATLEYPGLRFIAWPEILARAPVATRAAATPYSLLCPSFGAIVPDALFGLEYDGDGKKRYRFFALEADRGTMPVVRSNPAQTSYLKKLSAYREAIDRQLHRAQWGVPNLLVLTVTLIEPHLAEIVTSFESRVGGSAEFLFKTFPSGRAGPGSCAPMPELLSQPWIRVGSPPLNLAS